MIGLLKRAWSAWDSFWFGSKDLTALALVRISLGLTMLLMYLSRQGDVARFYGENSIVPRELTNELIPEFYRMTFQWFFWPDAMAGSVHALFVFLLLLVTLGVGGRILILAAWVLHMGFLYRNYSVAFGGDLIGGIFLFYLAGTQCCERLSLWNYLRGKKGAEVSDLATNVFYRLIQLQLCVIYAFTGFEKLKGLTWWDGTALWTVFANSQLTIIDLSWMRAFPTVIALLTFSTIVTEIYWPALVWNKKLRLPVLLVGVAFHSGIAIVMALPTFAAVMLSPYWLFVPADLLSKLRRK